MFNPYRFASGVIRPVLQNVDFWSPSAEKLILGTGLVESRLDKLYQIKGPALGVFQMEPLTHDDIWDTFLKYNPNATARVQRYMVRKDTPDKNELVWNLAYATVMCRMKYLRVPEALPHSSDFKGMAHYWKQHYNTPRGKGREEDFLLYMQMYGGYRI